ncbi:uncharacterized protein LOC125178617 [Hyalella azteca]|uniref:Uncharacterized protein LOC125178617 n=1 Tax=Hyalella azteca TaxID=294128 RepID=A0A979FQ61_HYAAZ|nr:uncharacterized protein LOC125178617 [Hyalella azteca]
MGLYGGWYRPLGELENHSAYLYDNHNYGISYVVRIATSRPTNEDDVRRVFTLLLRKTINLRMVPAERDGQLWLKEMKHHQDIDLQVFGTQTLLDVDVKTVFEEMAGYKYNMNDGPVWAVRFLPQSPKHDDYIRLTTMENADNKVITLPHVCHFVLSFHHSIADGYTCVRIIRHVLVLLNDVIEGNPIDESQQYAQILDITKQNVIFEEIERAFSENPDLLKARSKRLDTFFPDALLSQVYEHPSKTLPKIVSLPRILDGISTTKFVERCKKEGVTVHSGFCSVLEASVVQALQDAFLMQDRYTIASRHCVDQRRYFNDAANAYGTALGVLTLTTDVPRDICSNFWSHVKKFHQDFAETKRESVFKEKLERVFDVAHKDAPLIMKIEEYIAFLVAQRQSGRPGYMGGIDAELACLAASLDRIKVSDRGAVFLRTKAARDFGHEPEDVNNQLLLNNSPISAKAPSHVRLTA